MNRRARESTQNTLSIDASPTKELFIEMLTRDVALIPAIVDLADNSTDGARRTRGDGSWDGLYVKIEASPSKFVITDNCRGISVDVARQYAFRFGRPSDAKTGEGEVGRFGVGMKRGLFKLGRHFSIHSTSKSSQFDVVIDVAEWERRPEWQFEFASKPIIDDRFADESTGTTVTVTRLHSEVKEHFSESGFIDDLRQELTAKLEESILKGLAVSVNGLTLKAHVRRLVADNQLAPAKKTFKVKGRTGGTVNIELWCGVDKPLSKSVSRAESGWYVFCNGRMLLEADKTSATCWGVEDDDTIPAYHPQYNGFRGLAYLDADDAADLPWNTTKTALDTDHPVYRRVRQEMSAIARPVIDYFNKKKEENDALLARGEEGRGQLQILLDDAKVLPLEEIRTRAFFKTPSITVKKQDKHDFQRIQFDCPIKKARKVKESLGVSSWMKVGEEVFNYYYNAEVANE